MLKKLAIVVTGGNTGADQAGLRAAKAAGIHTAGYACRGWLTEDGPAPWLATEYGLKECEKSGYPARTEVNVSISDAVLWFGNINTPGAKCTFDAAKKHDRPVFIVNEGIKVVEVLAWLDKTPPELGMTLMVAGNRESKFPGIGQRAEAFLVNLLGRLK